MSQQERIRRSLQALHAANPTRLSATEWAQVMTEEYPEIEFRDFQRIRLKHIKEMLGQLNQDATGIHLLRAEEAAIKEFLGEPA